MNTDLPLRHDGVTMTCPVCEQPFTPNGRRRFCTDACKAVAYRRRQTTRPAPTLLPAQQRRPVTVYECATCGHRALGQQRCDDCNTFMTRIGYGGLCPCCDEPTATNELLDQEPTRPA